MKKQLDLARKNRPAPPPVPPAAPPAPPKLPVTTAPPPPTAAEVSPPAKLSVPPQDLDRPYKSTPQETRDTAKPQLLFPLLIVVILLMIGFVFYLYVSS